MYLSKVNLTVPIKALKNLSGNDQSDAFKIFLCFEENPIKRGNFLTQYVYQAAENFIGQGNPENGCKPWRLCRLLSDLKGSLLTRENFYAVRSSKYPDRVLSILQVLDEAGLSTQTNRNNAILACQNNSMLDFNLYALDKATILTQENFDILMQLKSKQIFGVSHSWIELQEIDLLTTDNKNAIIRAVDPTHNCVVLKALRKKNLLTQENFDHLMKVSNSNYGLLYQLWYNINFKNLSISQEMLDLLFAFCLDSKEYVAVNILNSYTNRTNIKLLIADKIVSEEDIKKLTFEQMVILDSCGIGLLIRSPEIKFPWQEAITTLTLREAHLLEKLTYRSEEEINSMKYFFSLAGKYLRTASKNPLTLQEYLAVYYEYRENFVKARAELLGELEIRKNTTVLYECLKYRLPNELIVFITMMTGSYSTQNENLCTKIAQHQLNEDLSTLSIATLIKHHGLINKKQEKDPQQQHEFDKLYGLTIYGV